MVARPPAGSAALPHEEGGRFALCRVVDAWYVACLSSQLAAKPLARRILGTPIVLFRERGGRPAALLDRCAHRNVPLSDGECITDRLQCAYHGWQYDREGICRNVPALLGPQEGRARRVPAFATREVAGYVWVYARPDVEPTAQPMTLPYLGAPGYHTAHFEQRFGATLLATAENILDVPHTAFLHRGLFRGAGAANRITAVIRRSGDRVETEYLGEPRPAGILGRLLAPRGGTVAHFDRFILPSVAQVEYRLGERSHLVITNLLTPVDDFSTHLHAVVSFKLPFAGALVRAVVSPFARRVARQDAVILARQTESVQAFGGEHYVSTDVDVMGGHILRLLRAAERGEQPPAGAVGESRVELLV